MDNSTMSGLLAWALALETSTPPDFTIGPDKNDPYLERRYVIPRTKENANVYLHRIHHSDNDVPHDHPWDNSTLVLENSYDEWTPNGVFTRKPGDVIFRKATDVHRLIITTGKPALTLFFTGPVIRKWGFHCPKGWVPFDEFVKIEDSNSSPGRGCGELA